MHTAQPHTTISLFRCGRRRVYGRTPRTHTFCRPPGPITHIGGIPLMLPRRKKARARGPKQTVGAECATFPLSFATHKTTALYRSLAPLVADCTGHTSNIHPPPNHPRQLLRIPRPKAVQAHAGHMQGPPRCFCVRASALAPPKPSRAEREPNCLPAIVIPRSARVDRARSAPRRSACVRVRVSRLADFARVTHTHTHTRTYANTQTHDRSLALVRVSQPRIFDVSVTTVTVTVSE